jgi:hypothetical protein
MATACNNDCIILLGGALLPFSLAHFQEAQTSDCKMAMKSNSATDARNCRESVKHMMIKIFSVNCGAVMRRNFQNVG